MTEMYILPLSSRILAPPPHGDSAFPGVTWLLHQATCHFPRSSSPVISVRTSPVNFITRMCRIIEILPKLVTLITACTSCLYRWSICGAPRVAVYYIIRLILGSTLPFCSQLGARHLSAACGADTGHASLCTITRCIANAMR